MSLTERIRDALAAWDHAYTTAMTSSAPDQARGRALATAALASAALLEEADDTDSLAGVWAREARAAFLTLHAEIEHSLADGFVATEETDAASQAATDAARATLEVVRGRIDAYRPPRRRPGWDRSGRGR